MQRWRVCSPWLIPRRCRLPSAPCCRWNCEPLRSSRPLSTVDSHPPTGLTLDYRPSGPFSSSVFNKVDRPKDIDAWTSLLDGALPAHLRLPQGSSSVPLDAVELAEVLLAAQYPGDSFLHSKGLDLLFHLGFEQGRWDAVVWLVKCIVERFPIRPTTNDRLSDVVRRWPGKLPLNEETANPVRLDPSRPSPQFGSLSLDDLTKGPLQATRPQSIIQHHALGQIWRSLGTMTHACAGGDVRPEVLELLAYIHHHGFMPEAIYRYNAHPDKCVIQQPPLLSLLSSRILTSLSDAAWRAHERNVIQEVRAREGNGGVLPLELTGSSYRVNIAGLRPELWMELILWSSLHGGWTFHGMAILRTLIADRSKPMWKPLSWREYESQLRLTNAPNSEDWEDLDYVFKTRNVSDMLDSVTPSLQIDRTVSAEVVNAYIDALVNSIDVGVGQRGLPMEQAIAQLHQFQTFLGRSRLSRDTGTWDALIVRLLEHSMHLPEQNIGSLENMISLSSGMGQGLESMNTEKLPSYVLDGSMAIQGFLHRALRAQIMTGSLEGAMHVFRILQERTDKQKRKSLVSFMSKQSSFLSGEAASAMFTSNFPGIDYPPLDLQIPSTILGQFLDLVTETEAFEFGRWLLHSQDVDGPVISPRVYKDPTVQAAVIRFAAKTNDKTLLSQFKGSPMSMNTLRSLFDNQIGNRRWDSAVRILESMKLVQTSTWSLANLAKLSRVSMECSSSLASGQIHTKSDADLQRAQALFSDMVRGKFDQSRPSLREHSIQTLLWVLSTINPEWASYCATLQQHHSPISFGLGTTAFNTVLSAIADMHGSAKARATLDTFWPQSARNILRSHGTYAEKTGRTKMPRYRVNASKSIERHRIVLQLPNISGHNADVVLLGALDATPSTILVVFRKALQELQAVAQSLDDETSPSAVRETILWTLRRFSEISLNDHTILRQVDQALSDQGMLDVKAQFPALFGGAKTWVPGSSTEGSSEGMISDERVQENNA